MLFFKLFWVFTKIGFFGFGGGYAMLSLIQEEVVDNNSWMTKQEFTDLVAISQLTPGPIGINTATYAGYSAFSNLGYSHGFSILGAVVATLALCLPSFLMVSMISYFFVRFRSNRFFNAAMKGISPIVIALIALAAVSLANKETFIDYWSPLLFVAALVAALYFKFHPILILVGAALVGLIIY